jgi:hypothetical protein
MLSNLTKTLFAANARRLLDQDDSSSLKIGVLTDLHLNLRYDENYDTVPDDEGDCWSSSGTLTDIKAPMGRYGCDPPMTLIDTMLDAFKEYHGEQDVIFLTGDLNAHHVAMNAELYPEGGDTY